MKISRKQIVDGETIPSFYRIAYLDLCSLRYTCYPIGLHLIARFIRRVWEWTLYYRPSKIEQIIERAIAKEKSASYSRGYQDGANGVLLLQGIFIGDESCQSES